MTRTEYVFGRLTAIYGDEFSRKFRPVGQTAAQIETHVRAMTGEWDRALRGFGSDAIAGALDALAEGRSGTGKCPNLPELVRMIRDWRPVGQAQSLLLANEGPKITPEQRRENLRRLKELMATFASAKTSSISGAAGPGFNDQDESDSGVAA
jgi:hypothetical protein